MSPAGPLPWTPNRVCVMLLNMTVRLLYGRRLTDEATCYKAFRGEILRRMALRCERFEFCPEVTAKACRMGVRLLDKVPIGYTPRSRVEGKKIRLAGRGRGDRHARPLAFRPVPGGARDVPGHSARSPQMVASGGRACD